MNPENKRSPKEKTQENPQDGSKEKSSTGSTVASREQAVQNQENTEFAEKQCQEKAGTDGCPNMYILPFASL